MPASVKLQDGGGITKSETDYTYDEGTVSAPTGTTPHHVGITGSRGNATTIKNLVQGSTFLINKTSYFDTGNPKTVTDVNNAQTTYNYPDATSTCGNAFPTSITEPVGSMTRGMTWNCTGAVQLSATDEIGKTTTTAYANDHFYWRPDSITDPTNAVTNFSYPSSSPYNWVESKMTLNSNSVVDQLTTTDTLGRVHLQQTRQGPSASNYDTVETDYDALGRVSRATLTYSGTNGQTNSTAPASTFTFDALSRTKQATDAGNGTTSYTYNRNDTLIAVGPAPTGESLKQRQFEYDSLGRLISVCEITAAGPSGNCGQQTSASGYLTNYSYDALGNLTGVLQNAQPGGTAQSRSYSFDGLGRLTSETNPESGTTSFTYDSATGCTGTFNGDLVKRVDAVTNSVCYAYDLLHRNTSITYSGTYASVTPSKYFVYDTATVNGVAMANAKSRLAEAYTCTTCPGTKITDLGLSYTARGETSDVYELTPHSSPSYYHVAQTYWPHGAPSLLSATAAGVSITGLPNLSYGGTIGSTVGLDGEGRIMQVTASGTGQQNPVTAIAYNAASLPTQVTYGSADTDIFAYDPYTLRMNSYQFKVGSQSVTGTLGWNANGSLGTLGVSDPFNSANTQNCSYSADDLSRITKADCGTIWGQTFSYDPFGNITKNKITGSGATSFTPTYQTSPITNRVASVGGTSATYDANGNSLNDTFRTYTWDADGKPVTIASATLTYDAFDRMVEQTVGSTNSEIVYGPGGDKLALMNGSTLIKAFVPLTGGATAVYTSSGLAYYRHTDHLGSSPLSSTPTSTVYSDTAYSAFGEPYAQSGALDPAFTGQNQDTTAGLYDFLYREYDPNQGRWASPDPAGLAAGNPAFPQSWNRYAYVMNNPLNFIDPTGLDCVYLNDDGTGVYSIDSVSNVQECAGMDANGNPNGGVWFNGTVDPDSISIDPNSDWVFANGMSGENEFSCGGNACDQASLTSFVDSIIGSDPVMVYGKSENRGTITSGLSFDETVAWFENNHITEHAIEGSHDPWHWGKLNLRDNKETCSTHVNLSPKSGQNGQPTTGEFHVDSVNPWVSINDHGRGISLARAIQPAGHLLGDLIPGALGIRTSAAVCH
jgi:RHS repeat-associated protein